MTDQDIKIIRMLEQSEAPFRDFVALSLEEKTPAVCQKIIEMNPYAIGFVPRNVINIAMCYSAVKQAGRMIQFVPSKFLDDDICLKAVEKSLDAIKHIPQEFRSKKVCLRVVQDCESWEGNLLPLLKEIPHKEIVQDAYRMIAQDGIGDPKEAFKHIKPESLTKDFVAQAFANEPDIFPDIPDKYKTQGMCLEAVKFYSPFIEHVPACYKTDLVCQEAVEEDHSTLKYCTEEFLTEEKLLNLLERDPNVLLELPVDKFTPNICEKVAETGILSYGRVIPFTEYKVKLLGNHNEDDKSLEWVLPSWISNDMSVELGKAILDNCPHLYADFPEALQEDKELALYALDKLPDNLRHLKQEFITEEIGIKAITNDYEVISYLPAHLDRKETYEKLVQIDGTILPYVPERYRTKELCIAAIESSFGKDKEKYHVFKGVPYTDIVIDTIRKEKDKETALMIFRYVPEERQTVDLVSETIKKNINVLGWVRSTILNEEHCAIACNHAPYMLLQIPSRFATPEFCLKVAMKDYEEYRPYIPVRILDEENVCSFYDKLRKTKLEEFSYEEVKDIYNGKPFTHTYKEHLSKKNRTQHLKWDKVEKKFIEIKEKSLTVRKEQKRGL